MKRRAAKSWAKRHWIFLLDFGFGAGRRQAALACRRIEAAASGSSLAGSRPSLLRTILEAAKDHFAGGGLMDGGHDHVHGLVDQPPSAIDDDHRSVFEISDALVGFLSLPEDEHAHGFARKHGGTQSVGEFVDVENGDSLNG